MRLAIVLLLLWITPLQAAPLYVDAADAAPLLARAETGKGYWALTRYYVSERQTTYCGVATAVMVLNALEVASPPAPTWHPYAKFDENNFFTADVLKISDPGRIGQEGLTLDQVGGMLATFGVSVEVHYGNTVSVDQFRAQARAAMAAGRFVTVNFLRTAIDQVGSGHHSPLAAYDAASDRFLLFDVARYKYPPSWVPAAELAAAMNTPDGASGKMRGFLIVGK